MSKSHSYVVTLQVPPDRHLLQENELDSLPGLGWVCVLGSLSVSSGSFS